MFLALDESTESEKMIIGAVLIPQDKVPSFERDFVSLRIKHKLFGELKWQDIDQYHNRYIEFIDLFFASEATFHSICYRIPQKKYHAAYVLLRTIAWKLINAGKRKSLFVLFDNDGSLGRIGTKNIKEIIPKDSRFNLEIEFCNQGTSHILGLLQIADILTGAVCSVVNETSLSPEKIKVVDHITRKNDGIELNWSSFKLPKLLDYKLHYFDPNNKP